MKEIIGYEEKLFHTYKLYKQRQTWRNLQDTEKKMFTKTKDIITQTCPLCT